MTLGTLRVTLASVGNVFDRLGFPQFEQLCASLPAALPRRLQDDEALTARPELGQSLQEPERPIGVVDIERVPRHL